MHEDQILIFIFQREIQRRMEPITDGSFIRRRKKGPTRQQPLLTVIHLTMIHG